MYESLVGEHSLLSAMFRDVQEFTLERNTIDASSVGKPSHIPLTLKGMKELPLERNPIDASNVGKRSLKLLKF